jgi:hypothetical protein
VGPLVLLAFAALTAVPKPTAHCWDDDDEVPLKKSVRAEIVAAVRRCSRFPVVRIEVADPKAHPPAGTVAALTIVRGGCGDADGDVFWVHRGHDGWRVLKKVGNWGVRATS